MTAILFVVLAIAGTLLRAQLTAEPEAGALPWRTLAVNCTGAALLGVFAAGPWAGAQSVALTVGGLGSLTTFSTVAAEAAGLADEGHRRTALLYVTVTLIAAVAAAWLGLEIGQSLNSGG